MNKTIANNELTQTDLPAPNAEWYSIAEFALTFNGYEQVGSFEKCGGIANRISRAYDSGECMLNTHALAELRTCLFFEQRRWRHFDEVPDVKTMIYIHDLIEAIRKKV